MKTKFFSITAALVCVAVICFAVVADLSGKWVGTVKGFDGNDLQLTYTFKVDGNTLTGSIGSPQGELPISEGKINGTDFSYKLDFNGTAFTTVGKYYVDSVGLTSDINGMKFHTRLLRGPN